MSSAEVQREITAVVRDTIESLYSGEVDAYSRLYIYQDSWTLSLGGNKLISISKDGKKLNLRNYYYRIDFNISSLEI